MSYSSRPLSSSPPTPPTGSTDPTGRVPRRPAPAAPLRRRPVAQSPSCWGADGPAGASVSLSHCTGASDAPCRCHPGGKSDALNLGERCESTEEMREAAQLTFTFMRKSKM